MSHKTLCFILVLCIIGLTFSGCGGETQPSGAVDSDIDADLGTDPDADPDYDDPDGSNDGQVDSDDNSGPCGISQAEHERLLIQVHDYLIGVDDTLPGRYDEEFGHVCFEALAEAIRSWPGEDVSPPEDVLEESYIVPISGASNPLFVYVPETLVLDGSERVPLILWLHGAGDSGRSAPSNASFQEVAQNIGAILAAPSAPVNCDWSAEDRCASIVHGAIDHVKRLFPIDHDRIYLSGHSMGGRGTLSVALSFPGDFAAQVAVAGSIGAIHGSEDIKIHTNYVRPHIENAEFLRTVIITGLEDHPLLVLQNQATADVFEEVGYEFRWNALEGFGHGLPLDLWAESMGWISEVSRDPAPMRTHYTMAEHASGQFNDLYLNVIDRRNVYWLRIDERIDIRAMARVQGQIKGQHITITAENVFSLTVLLSDDLVDLDEDIVITVNDQPWFEGSVERDPIFALEFARHRNERSMVYSTEISDRI